MAVELDKIIRQCIIIKQHSECFLLLFESSHFYIDLYYFQMATSLL